MIFYILISIVFLAEMIITATIMCNLVKLDKQVCVYNEFIAEVKSKIKDLLGIVRKISEQMVELAPVFVEKMKSILIKIMFDQIKNVTTAVTFWVVKNEVSKRI